MGAALALTSGVIVAPGSWNRYRRSSNECRAGDFASARAENMEEQGGPMPSLTRSFERAVAKASTLPADEQDTLAALILAEIEDTRRWDDLLNDDRSVTLLGQLAAEALAEDDASLTEPLEDLLAGVKEETPDLPQTRR